MGDLVCSQNFEYAFLGLAFLIYLFAKAYLTSGAFSKNDEQSFIHGMLKAHSFWLIAYLLMILSIYWGITEMCL